MSIVIDGVDILDRNVYTAAAMYEKLTELLDKGHANFPMGVVHGAIRLFDGALYDSKKGRAKPESTAFSDPLIRSEARRMLTDSLNPSNPSAITDSDLELLAETLSSIHERHTLITGTAEKIKKLQELFGNMYNLSQRYAGTHSPYSVGTFDDSVDEIIYNINNRHNITKTFKKHSNFLAI